MTLAVEIPANTTATITLPGVAAAPVKESGAPLVKAPGISQIVKQSHTVTQKSELTIKIICDDELRSKVQGRHRVPARIVKSPLFGGFFYGTI